MEGRAQEHARVCEEVHTCEGPMERILLVGAFIHLFFLESLGSMPVIPCNLLSTAPVCWFRRAEFLIEETKGLYLMTVPAE